MHAHHRSHGKVIVGRIIVGAGCALVLAVNCVIYRQASLPNHQIPALKVISLISLVWIFAGASGMCARMNWGRPMMLTVLYVGSFAFGIAGVIMVAYPEGSTGWQLRSIFIGTAVYIVVSMVVTQSRHVRRLTSRIWE